MNILIKRLHIWMYALFPLYWIKSFQYIQVIDYEYVGYSSHELRALEVIQEVFSGQQVVLKRIRKQGKAYDVYECDFVYKHTHQVIAFFLDSEHPSVLSSLDSNAFFVNYQIGKFYRPEELKYKILRIILQKKKGVDAEFRVLSCIKKIVHTYPYKDIFGDVEYNGHLDNLQIDFFIPRKDNPLEGICLQVKSSHMFQKKSIETSKVTSNRYGKIYNANKIQYIVVGNLGSQRLEKKLLRIFNASI